MATASENVIDSVSLGLVGCGNMCVVYQSKQWSGSIGWQQSTTLTFSGPSSNDDYLGHSKNHG